MPDRMEGPTPGRSRADRVAVFSGGGTGGHLYPALNLARELSGVRPDVRPVFVGARRGLEARVVPTLGMEYLLLPVQGVARNRLLANLAVLPNLLRSMLSVSALYRRIRPVLVVVTGGYAAGPAGLAARIHGVPLVLQEQNAQPGATTRILSRWAREIHLAFPEARDALPAGARARVRITGNPVSPPMTGPAREEARQRLRESLGVGEGDRLVLVVGGSQGSRALNDGVTAWLRHRASGVSTAKVGSSLHILWSTGPAWIRAVEEAVSELSGQDRLHIRPFLDDMPSALAAADLAVSRAGAMATSEFLAWGVPAVLVPLPTAAADHQRRNAAALEAAGAARLLPEAELTGERLQAALVGLLDDPSELRGMAARARELGRPHASRESVDAMVAFLPPILEAA